MSKVLSLGVLLASLCLTVGCGSGGETVSAPSEFLPPTQSAEAGGGGGAGGGAKDGPVSESFVP